MACTKQKLRNLHSRFVLCINTKLVCSIRNVPVDFIWQNKCFIDTGCLITIEWCRRDVPKAKLGSPLIHSLINKSRLSKVSGFVRDWRDLHGLYNYIQIFYNYKIVYFIEICFHKSGSRKNLLSNAIFWKQFMQKIHFWKSALFALAAITNLKKW